MDSFYRTSRRGTLVTIAICSMLGGLVLIWHLLRPGVINLIPTTQLLILLGLFVLPVVTVGAWAMDLKHLKSAAAPRNPLGGEDSEHASLTTDPQTDPHAEHNVTHGRAPGRDAAGAGRGPETHRHRRTSDAATPR